MFPDTQMYAFSNVHIKVKNMRNHRIIKEIHKKNAITKYALNGIASMIKGEFNDTNYNLINNYVPKYLALGTNLPSESDPNITTGVNVTVFDNSLCSEIRKNGRFLRIKLEEARRIDNLSTNEYVKIRFKTMVMAGTIGYSTAVQELGLFVDNKELQGGLWARISTDPITIPENSVLDVIWDVVLASSVGVYPSRIALTDPSGRIISKDENGIEINYNTQYPIAVSLASSIIDGTTMITSHFDISEREVDDGTEVKYRYISANNFSIMIRTVQIYKDGAVYKIRSRWDENYDWEDYKDEQHQTVITFDSVELAKPDARILAHQGLDINGNIVSGDGVSVEAYKYKEVTYKNCAWTLSYDNNGNEVEILLYDTSITYFTGDFVMYNNQVFKCINETSGEFDESDWFLVMTFINYMINCIIINENYDQEHGNDDERFKITATAASGISDYTYIIIKKND